MLFKDLYDKVEETVTKPYVRFDMLRDAINLHHAGVGKIELWAIKYPIPNKQAHYKLTGRDRTSPYEEAFDLAEIRYCEELDEHPRERRFALTKELMHVFDMPEERVDSREKFVSFLKEIQNQPLASQRSDSFNSELNTRWMAAIILCPKHLRDQFLQDYQDRNLQPFEVAEIFRVPEWIIPSVMGDYYDVAWDVMMNKGSQSQA